MQLSNTVPVRATPEEVFALVADVERVASCMPGAVLEGREGDAWSGRVRVKVGPITAAYAGTVRFLEVDAEQRRLRLQARGADTHGSGDAEAEVTLLVAQAAEGAEGAELRLTTDLVIRGKIAQFGKGAVAGVSDRILRRFAENLGALLDQDRSAESGSAPAQGHPAVAQPPARTGVLAAPPRLDGLATLFGPAAAKYAPVAGAFAFGLFEGWLLGRALSRERQHCCGVRAAR